MRVANTSAVDAAISQAASRRDALGREMATSPEVANSRMPDMIALCQEISELEVQRALIIRETFYPRK